MGNSLIPAPDGSRTYTSTEWGQLVRDRWLPEDVDPRPWAERCGYEPTGIPHTRIDGVISREDRDEIDAARARGSSAALKGALARAGRAFRGITTEPGEWTETDAFELMEAGPRLGVELLAAALRRTPQEIRERASEVDVDIETGSVEWYVTPAKNARKELYYSQAQLGVLSRLGWPPEGFSVRDLADALGFSPEGAAKALDRVGAHVRRTEYSVLVPVRAAYLTLVDVERRRRALGAVCMDCGDTATRGRTAGRPRCDTCRKREYRAKRAVPKRVPTRLT